MGPADQLWVGYPGQLSQPSAARAVLGRWSGRTFSVDVVPASRGLVYGLVVGGDGVPRISYASEVLGYAVASPGPSAWTNEAIPAAPSVLEVRGDGLLSALASAMVSGTTTYSYLWRAAAGWQSEVLAPQPVAAIAEHPDGTTYALHFEAGALHVKARGPTGWGPATRLIATAAASRSRGVTTADGVIMFVTTVDTGAAEQIVVIQRRTDGSWHTQGIGSSGQVTSVAVDGAGRLALWSSGVVQELFVAR
jgi:hypothetical protein